MKSPEFISPEERKQIASQIKAARRNEAGPREGKGFYGINRTGKEFLCRIGGLEQILQYARNLDSNIILDIGTGTGRASKAISKMQIASGFDYHVTALRHNPELSKNFPNDKIHLTEAEVLRGIKNNSVAVVLGLNSLGYTKHPEIVTRRLDEVLVPGGVIKGTFNTIGESSQYGESEMQDPQEMAKYLLEMGYDVSFKDFGFYSVGRLDVSPYMDNAILLAIKPGENHVPAEEMLYDDVEKMRTQAVRKDYEGDVYNIADDPE